MNKVCLRGTLQTSTTLMLGSAFSISKTRSVFFFKSGFNTQGFHGPELFAKYRQSRCLRPLPVGHHSSSYHAHLTAQYVLRFLSMYPEKSRWNGVKPHCRFSQCRIVLVLVKAKIGPSGKILLLLLLSLLLLLQAFSLVNNNNKNLVNHNNNSLNLHH